MEPVVVLGLVQEPAVAGRVGDLGAGRTYPTVREVGREHREINCWAWLKRAGPLRTAPGCPRRASGYAQAGDVECVAPPHSRAVRGPLAPSRCTTRSRPGVEDVEDPWRVVIEPVDLFWMNGSVVGVQPSRRAGLGRRSPARSMAEGRSVGDVRRGGEGGECPSRPSRARAAWGWPGRRSR